MVTKITRFYDPWPNRKTTPFLKIDGYCSECPKGSKTLFYFTTSNQFDDSKDYVAIKTKVVG